MKSITLKKPLMLTLMMLFCLTTFAQVSFTVSQKQKSPTELEVYFTGKMDKGWHVYSPNIGPGGPSPAVLTTEKAEGVKPVGKLRSIGKEISSFDKMFEMNMKYFENKVTFVQKYKITGKTYNVKGYLNYSACNDESCLPPTNVEFSYSGKGAEDAPEAKEELVADTAQTLVADTAKTDTAKTVIAVGDDQQQQWWKPSLEEMKAFGNDASSSHSLWYIFLMGIVGGILALFMPCIWPIIPMTVSFFLKRAKASSKACAMPSPMVWPSW